ncbi:glycoside hydrolase family 39 [Thermobaculum terrenum ATCC BAA-798]|uniref:Glycoside hydrolase family 39 n=1 Tax=Thermobaculum terrenum (strain ATCC BAA-798 / CCMEE 7001 / YNP1) TaxID=525904 RepID=D1CI48_THET1|nr:glycoside hydrolase [Thermobaculum terrenum]ACZ43419.1 glycoside hydrolase family 39 [Thermobaculum terrenum ATCC BAA-798]
MVKASDVRAILTAVLMIGLVAVAGLRGTIPAATATHYREITVDTNTATGAFNRALFSVTGYAQLKVSAQPIAQDTYAMLHPAGTQQRIETMIDQTSPEPGTFYPDRMFRFVDNTDDAYFREVTGKGMEPVLLLAYNTPWLTRTGALNEPPTDPQAWADIASKVIEHYNGDGSDPNYKLRVKYVEIWNEPNLDQFWSGTDEQYFELFRVVARTIHARFPGVMVGGPVYSPGAPGYYEYGQRFVDAVGEEMDFFVYHSYGDSVAKIRSDIELWRDYIASHTSHHHPKLMVTESEQFITDDAAKLQYMLDRQFALLDYADTLLGWHQFCLYEYREGWYTFGLIHGDGSVFPGNYWPYWLFRDASGRTLRVTASSPSGGAGPEHYVATRSEDGRKINLVYWRPQSASGDQVTRFSFVLPRDGVRRVFTASLLLGDTQGVVDAEAVEGTARRFNYTLRLPPGAAVSLTLDDAARASAPWLGLTSTAGEVPLHGTFEVTATLLNSTPDPISGEIGLRGLPPNWTVMAVSGNPRFANLETGDSTSVTWSVKADTVTDGPLAFYAQVALGDGRSTHSIPVRVQVLRPVRIVPVPDYTYFAPGETRQFTLRLTNALSTPIDGTVALEGPASWSPSAPQALSLDAHQTREYAFTLTAPVDAALGTATAYARVTLGGDTYTRPISLVVKQYDPNRPSTIVDLSPYYNGDGFSYDSNPGDGDLDYSGFLLPADTFPGNQRVRYMGVLFQTPDVADGARNEVAVDGQTVSVPAGSYKALAMLVNATNGDRSGTVKLTYAGGEREAVPLQVSDWCAGAHYGEEAVIWFDHRHSPSGDAQPPCGIYYTEVPVDPGRTLQAVSFPSEPNLHLFALSGVGP